MCCRSQKKLLTLQRETRKGASRRANHPAAIAQLVEHFIRNEKVVGSSPTRGS